MTNRAALANFTNYWTNREDTEALLGKLLRRAFADEIARPNGLSRPCFLYSILGGATAAGRVPGGGRVAACSWCPRGRRLCPGRGRSNINHCNSLIHAICRRWHSDPNAVAGATFTNKAYDDPPAILAGDELRTLAFDSSRPRRDPHDPNPTRRLL